MQTVKFAVIAPTYSTTHKRLVMGTDPVVEHVEGRLAPTRMTLEGENTSGDERTRPIGYRLIFQRTQALEDLVKAGSIILITHKRHRLTNSWRELNPSEQYIVNNETQVSDVGDEMNIGLVSKDQS